MTMRLVLAAALAAGLTFAPAAFAEPATKPVLAKNKTHKSANAHRKTVNAPKPSGKMKKHDNMMGEPYSAQRDDMTR